MSIQLLICSPRELWEEIVISRDSSERQRNRHAFEALVKEKVRSCDLDFRRLRLEDGETFDLAAADAIEVDRLTRAELPSFTPVLSIELFIPCLDPDERFMFSFTLLSNGNPIAWPVADSNVLMHWMRQLRAAAARQTEDVQGALTRVIQTYEASVALAKQRRMLVSVSY